MGPSGHLWVRQLPLPTDDPLDKVANGAFSSKLEDGGGRACGTWEHASPCYPRESPNAETLAALGPKVMEGWSEWG